MLKYLLQTFWWNLRNSTGDTTKSSDKVVSTKKIAINPKYLRCISDKLGPIVAIEKLNGLSNNNYKITIQEEASNSNSQVVLKILQLNQITSETQEHQFNSILSGNNLTTKLLLNGYPDFYVFKYFEGKTIDTPQEVFLNSNTLLQDFAHQLARLHSLPVDNTGLKQVNVGKSALKFLRKTPKNSTRHQITTWLHRSLLQVNKLPKHLAFTHNDLNADNILYSLTGSPSIIFIDFEYTAYNDVFFDLISVYNMVGEEKFSKFKSVYCPLALPKVTPKLFMSKLKAFHQLSSVVTMCWYYYMSYHAVEHPNLKRKYFANQFKLLFNRFAPTVMYEDTK